MIYTILQKNYTIHTLGIRHKKTRLWENGLNAIELKLNPFSKNGAQNKKETPK